MTQACIDGISDSVAGMRTQTDPFAAQSESLATSGAGELERLRWTLSRALGWPYWYSLDQNINFAHAGATGYIQGSGFARHVTAVGYHAWAGSARFPVYSTVNFHLTGLWFPRAGTQPRWTVAHHLAVSVGSGIDRDQTGIEVARFHLEALQFHHTVALRFAHSQALNTAWQYPHITAISLVQPQRGPDGVLPTPVDGRGIDQLIFGHAGTVLQMVGYGASHIALGRASFVALGRHVGTMSGPSGATPVANALYADTMIKGWVFTSGGVNPTPLNAFNVAGLSRLDGGQYLITWERAMLVNYAVVVSAFTTAAYFATLESQNTTHAVVRTWSTVGAPGIPVDAGFSAIAVGQQ